MRRSALACTALMLSFTATWAEDNAITEGRSLAEANCRICHAIGPQGDSTLREAPPFRDIAARYDDAELEDAFNEGVATEHPAMPDWQMTPEQAHQLAAYIMTLAPYGMKKTELVQ